LPAAGEQLENIFLCPASNEEKLANIHAVITFMTHVPIRMHHIAAHGTRSHITMQFCLDVRFSS
jgi:hypothetical protein